MSSRSHSVRRVKGTRGYSPSQDTSGKYSDLDGFESFTSSETMRLWEGTVNAADRHRFIKDLENAARKDPEVAEWIKANFDALT